MLLSPLVIKNFNSLLFNLQQHLVILFLILLKHIVLYHSMKLDLILLDFSTKNKSIVSMSSNFIIQNQLSIKIRQFRSDNVKKLFQPNLDLTLLKKVLFISHHTKTRYDRMKLLKRKIIISLITFESNVPKYYEKYIIIIMHLINSLLFGIMNYNSPMKVLSKLYHNLRSLNHMIIKQLAVYLLFKLINSSNEKLYPRATMRVCVFS